MMKRICSGLMIGLMLLWMCTAAVGVAAESNQVVNEGGTTVQTAQNGGFDISISKTIEAVEGKENFFDITLTANTHKHVADTSTDVVVVMDVSNTMNADGKLASAKQAAAAFVTDYARNTTLFPKRFGLVTFNTDAKTVVGLTGIDSESDAAAINQNYIDKIVAPTGSVVVQEKFTNIEGGLQLAYNLLQNADSRAKYRYVVLITDGFPTTYIASDRNSTTEIKGYDTYMSHFAQYSSYQDRYVNTDGYFANTHVKRACLYGVDYSNRGAVKTQAIASTIKSAGINIFSVGVGIGGMTIQNYLNAHQGKEFSTVDTTGMSEDAIRNGQYAIGSASNTDSYINWMKNTIAGGPHISLKDDRYLSADNAKEFEDSVGKILSTIETTPYTQLREFYTHDPMGDNIEFLHFFDRDGKKKGNALNGVSKENAENTAVYGGTNNTDRIYWNLMQSGFQLDANGNYSFRIKYRVRLENENAGYTAAGLDQKTNKTTTLSYHSEYADGTLVPDGDGTMEYKIPEVEGYFGSLKFLKQDENTKEELEGIEFTLMHYGESCSVCEGEAEIAPITKVTDAEGMLEMTRIPSGHEYHLRETGKPDGYTPISDHTVIVAYGNTYIDEKTNAKLLVDGRFTNDHDNDFVIYNSKAEPVELQLRIGKTLDGRAIKAGEFAFILTGRDQNGTDVHETAHNDANGMVVFEKMVFSEQGTYTFTIKEVVGEDGTVIYDSKVHTVVVAVEPRHSADSVVNKEHYYARVTVDGGTPIECIGREGIVETIEIPNAFSNRVRGAASAVIQAKKTLLDVNRQEIGVQENKFKFILQGVGENSSVSQTAYCDRHGNVLFGPIFYETPGEYRYTLREIMDEGVADPNYVYDAHIYDVIVTVTAPQGLTEQENLKADVSYMLHGEETQEAVFSNKERKPASLTLRTVKTLEGSELLAGTFAFELVQIGADNTQTVLETVSHDKDGKITFKTLVYDAISNMHDGAPMSDTYHYIIREKIGTDSGVVYDGIVYDIDVTVLNEGAEAYTLEVIINRIEDGETSFVGEARGTELNLEIADAFSNSIRQSASAVIQARKLVLDAIGNEMPVLADTFAFKLEGVGNDVNETVYSDASGMAVFTQMLYSEPGVYSYTLSEVRTGNGIDPNYVYDTSVYDVTVTVTAPEDLTDDTMLMAEVSYSLNNAAADEAVFINTHKSGSLTVKKTVEGNAANPEDVFTFEVVVSGLMDGVYGDMTFTGGVATVQLMHGEQAIAEGIPVGMTYTVTETDCGTYTPDVLCHEGTMTEEGAVAAFVNTRELVLLPKTGDHSKLALWCAMLIMAGVGLMISKRIRA